MEMGRKLSPGNDVVEGGALAGLSPMSEMFPDMKEVLPIPARALCEVPGARLVS